MAHWAEGSKPRRRDDGSANAERASPRLPVALSAAVIVLVVASVITVALLDKDVDGTPVAAEGARVSTPAPSPSGPPSSSVTDARPAEGRTENSAARLSYPVPPGWTKSDNVRKVLGVDFTGAIDAAPYTCDSDDRVRANAVSAAVQSPRGEALDPERTARAFADAFAAETYPGSTVDSTTARPGTVDGKASVTVLRKVRAEADGCRPTGGLIAVLAVDLDNATADRPRGLAVLVVTDDTAGGPSEPVAPSEDSIKTMLAETRVL